MFLGPRGHGSDPRIPVPRRHWQRWCGGRPVARRVPDSPECGRQGANPLYLPAREPDRAIECREERGFRVADALESLAPPISPIYTRIMPDKEPICLFLKMWPK